MASTTQRCSQCGISYPTQTIRCQVCGGWNELIEGKADADWATKVAQANAEPERDTTEEQVHKWRFDVLTRAGYSEYAADLLAASREDLHKMVDARTNGITDDQALKIWL